MRARRIQSNAFILLSLWTLLSMKAVPLYAEKQDHVAQQADKDSSEGLWVSPIYFNQTASEEDENEDHQYIVKYKDGSQMFEDRLHEARRRLSVDSSDSPSKYYDFIPGENAEVMTLTTQELKEWENNKEVDYVEKDTKVYPSGEVTPYGINAIHALNVPDIYAKNIKVCIVDSGYDVNHPDLPSAATGGTITGSNNGNAPWDVDGFGHGTHVAGTIAAIGGNGQGVVGILRNGEANLHIIRVFGDDQGWVWKSHIVNAVDECVESGAKIVNLSLGGPGYSKFEMQSYWRIHHEQNVLLVAAAGNAGTTAYSYPASYDTVMSVAAVDANNVHASFSQSNDQVDIAAPGISIQSTLIGNRYAAWTGTSMATPHVSGVAALIWSHFPDKSAEEVRQALIDSAMDLGDPGRDDNHGFGLLQADAAYNLLAATPSPTKSPTSTPTVSPTKAPTWSPTRSPTSSPTQSPTMFPTSSPTQSPTKFPTGSPTMSPTRSPTKLPTLLPTSLPTNSPTRWPTQSPTMAPTMSPTKVPTMVPSQIPSKEPTNLPSGLPSSLPTNVPTSLPSKSPSQFPTSIPTTLSPVRIQAFAPSSFTNASNTSDLFGLGSYGLLLVSVLLACVVGLLVIYRFK